MKGFLLLSVALLLLSNRRVTGDEGMWLFSNPPRDHLKKAHNFVPTDKWLDHVRLSSVRFNSGGSGSFVSADGLVMTNHHVGADDLQKLSDEKNNYLRDGFHARTRADEKKCIGLELNVLLAIADVTAKVEAAVTSDMKPEAAVAARRKVIADLEKGTADPAKNIRADVVTLYAGGQYHLYTLKKYTDIRLVFAPEQQIAFYGGDPDNFEYPRYDLDLCLFRVYENDAPFKTEHHLKWSADGSKEGELVFVSGHPGRTNRQNTVAELEYLRDTGYPFLMTRLNRLEVLLNSWSERTEENRRRARDELFGIQNSRKARSGGLSGLLDPQLMGRKIAEEKRLVESVTGKPDTISKDAAKAFEAIAAAEKVRVGLVKEMQYLEGGAAFSSSMYGIAKTLYRGAVEREKASGERLPEFGEARLQSLEFQLFSDEPHYDDLEILKLSDSLALFATYRGANDPLVKKILAGKSPRERAFDLISGTKLAKIEVRKALWEGKLPAIEASKDPMIALVKMVDSEARAIRKQFETQVDEPKRQAYAALARARYALDGANTYPDATFTLRLAYGVVQGYEEDGKKVPAFTEMGGLYARSAEHNDKPPFDLPPRWIKLKDKLDLKTPFNFVCTADIIGGNSGSPVINREGEVVGLIFDGNIQSLVLDFIFDEKIARAVSVDSRAIVESLKKVYDAKEILAELLGK